MSSRRRSDEAPADHAQRIMRERQEREARQRAPASSAQPYVDTWERPARRKHRDRLFSG